MPVKKKGTIFRVTGLSASRPDEELSTALKAAIYDNLTEDEQLSLNVKATVVPSCYSDEEKVALVEFQGGVPEFLSELIANPLGDFQIEMGDTDINFDQNFYLFTQLYTPTPGLPVTADIIAITGLNGHAYGSWRGKGNLGRMWLRDFLSNDLPHCRTMIYGYNSKLSTHGVNKIMDYGRELIEELKKIRDTDELRKRPLFFIAHSFGGIILAHCLVKAVQANEDDHATLACLYRATYGMILFGIPHKGLVVDDLQKMVLEQDNQSRSALLEQIKTKSDLLAYQLTDFKNLIRDRKVISFYEMGQTRQLEFDSKGKRWTRTGDFITSVDADSALLQLPDSIEDKIPLNTDHSMMVKFDTKNNQGYTSARDKLKQFEKDAPGVVAARFFPEKNKPSPCLMIPFQRDNAFVGREDILARIEKNFKPKASPSHDRAALIGLGGIGKSQIAIEYAYRVRESTPQTWVFWVYASDASKFKQAYVDIATKVELPGRDDPKADILRLVYNWLCDERNGRWLIIIDNADDDRVFSSPSAHLDNVAHGDDASHQAAPLERFLPQSSNGCVLVTSRDQVAAVNLVGTRHNVFQVEPMTEEDAIVLLNSRLLIGEDFEDDAKALVQTLECIPLAITHAAAYLAVRAQTITISTYLALFRESEENQAHLLSSQEIRDMRRDGISDAIITTWHISFEQIQKTKPEAAELFSLMAMFDRQGIPASILYNGKSRLQFEDAVAPLISFSLIKTLGVKQPKQEAQESIFEMHDLVQLAMRKWLEVQMQRVKWQKVSLRIMAVAFPSGDHGTWEACRMLIPHGRKVLSYHLQDTETIQDRTRIARKIVWYLCSTGEYAAAETMARIVVTDSERVLGVEHLDTLFILSKLALVLHQQGKYNEAEVMQRRVLRGRERVLEAEHPDILAGVNNLAITLSELGNHNEAAVMHRRVLQERERMYGLEHPGTLISVNNLATVLSRQGKYSEAEALHRRALQVTERVLGIEHPDTLISVSNLGWVFNSQGKYNEAEAMYRRALQVTERVLGVEHPNTLVNVSNLGLALHYQDRYYEAETMYRRALQITERVLEVEHPTTVVNASSLGLLLHSQRKYSEAETMYWRALKGKEKVLGVDHPHALSCLHYLGSLLCSQGKYDDAETVFGRAVQVREKVFGRVHPYTLRLASDLSFVLERQKQQM